MSILLIITDQLRHDAVGYNSSIAITPNINKLSKSGTTFTCCYTQSPQCHPSRVSLMTGRYPSTHRSWTNKHSIAPGEITISSLLSCECAYFGKVHLAGDNGNDRELMRNLGYDYWFTFQDWSELCKQIDSVIYTPLTDFANIMKTKNWVGKFDRRDLHHDEVITDKAISYIRNHDDYFIVLSYHGPHPPYAAPPPFSEMYKPKDMPIPFELGDRSIEEWQQIKSQYYGGISWIDDNIGRLLEVVSEETTVVFTSDHGDILGDHGYFSKGFFGYDGTTKVPLIIKTPIMINRVYDHVVQHIDIVPTLLYLLNIEIPNNIQGKSLVSAVNANTPVRDFALSMIGSDPKIKILRSGDYKYWIVGDVELVFNVVLDPQERNPITDENILSLLRKQLIKAMIIAEDV